MPGMKPAFRPSRRRTKIRRQRRRYPVSCMGDPGRTESLSHSEDASFDDDSVGASNRLWAEG